MEEGGRAGGRMKQKHHRIRMRGDGRSKGEIGWQTDGIEGRRRRVCMSARKRFKRICGNVRVLRAAQSEAGGEGSGSRHGTCHGAKSQSRRVERCRGRRRGRQRA